VSQDELHKKIIVWLAPMIIILTAVSVLFSKNYQEVTQPADDNWSRALKIGTTPFTQEPYVHQTEGGQLSVAFLTAEGVQPVMANAPGYLSFTGSSFIYLIGLALVSLVILKIGL
jgi:hypothetical protein